MLLRWLNSEQQFYKDAKKVPSTKGPSTKAIFVRQCLFAYVDEVAKLNLLTLRGLNGIQAWLAFSKCLSSAHFWRLNNKVSTNICCPFTRANISASEKLQQKLLVWTGLRPITFFVHDYENDDCTNSNNCQKIDKLSLDPEGWVISNNAKNWQKLTQQTQGYG